MQTEFNKTQSELTVKITGKIDSITAPRLEIELSKNMEDVTAMIIDFAEVKYISSAGLRVMISTKKKIDNLKLINLNDDITEVFKMVGFDSIFDL